MEQYLGHELQQQISPQAFKENELVKDSEVLQAIAIEQEEIIETDTGRPKIFLYVGPSGIGKTTTSRQIERLKRNDKNFRDRYRLVTGDPKHEYLPIQISLSEALNEVAYLESIKRGYPVLKKDLGDRERGRASDLMIRGAQTIRLAFRNHSRYTVGIPIDTVGVTDGDLGTSMVQVFSGDNDTYLNAPQLDVDIESGGMETRAFEEEHKDDPDFDEALRTQRKIISGDHPMAGRVHELILSRGDKVAWERHYKDIYRQIRERNSRIFIEENEPSEQQFFEMGEKRQRMYNAWLPERLRELGYDPHDAKRVHIFPVKKYEGDVHTHTDDLYGTAPQMKFHFPFSVLRDGRGIGQYTAEEIVTAMKGGVQRKMKGHNFYI